VFHGFTPRFNYSNDKTPFIKKYYTQQVKLKHFKLILNKEGAQG
jgi:hypothetical protein